MDAEHLRLTVLSTLLASLLLAMPVSAADSAPAAVPEPAGSATAPADEDIEILDEVVVKGTRLWELRAAIVKAEDRFYARWNELNKDRDFDMTCYMEAPLGTRLKKRVCRVAFYEDAQAEYAQAMVRGEFAPSPEQVAMERHVEYRKVAMELLNNDPQLRRLAREREAAEKKYNEERKKRFKGRWIIFE